MKMHKVQLTIKKYLRKIFYRTGSSDITGRIVSPWRGRAIIICFHRVLPDNDYRKDKSPNAGLAISKTMFREHLIYLKNNSKLISIDMLEEHLRAKTRQMAVVISFDDGWKDNIDHAWPILLELNVPAIIYITTQFIEEPSCMWTFKLWKIIERRERITLYLRTRNYVWDIQTEHNKLLCFDGIRNLVLNCSNVEKQSLLESIGVFDDPGDCENQFLNWKDIEYLNGCELMTIGAHTHTHPNLRILTDSDVVHEMLKSKRILENKLDHPIKHFAYPYGTKKEAWTREYQLAKEVGFTTAVTTNRNKLVYSELHSLPRHRLTEETTKSAIQAKLCGWNNLFRI